MAICKHCGADIPDGQELCEKCVKSQSNSPVSDESYLDSLLQNVVDPEATQITEDDSVLVEDDLSAQDDNLSDIMELTDTIKEEPVPQSFDSKENEALSTELLNSEESDSSESEKNDSESVDLDLSDLLENNSEDIPVPENVLESSEITNSDDSDSIGESLEEPLEEDSDSKALESLEPAGLEDINLDSLESIDLENLESDNMNSEEVQDDLLPKADVATDESEEETQERVNEVSSDEDLSEENVEEEIESNPMEDVEDLLGMLESETEQNENNSLEVPSEEVTEEVPKEEISKEEIPNELEDTVTDDIFSLDGMDNIEDLLSDSVQSIENLDKKQDKEEIFHELDDLEDNLENTILEEVPSKEELKKKKGIFQKIFGNIYDAKSEKAHKKMEENEEKTLQKKEEKKKKKAEKAAAKNDPAVKAEKEAKKKEKEEKKAAAKAAKEAKKKEKEEKKKERLAKEEAEAKEDPGRINPIGASIVFVLVGAITVFVIFGSRNFSYTRSVVKANEYFAGKEYNEAYEEVKGITIKDKDSETYDKIITVMYVNKQLNSYNNYYAMQMYPQALDSLLKGLKKYDEYINTAKQLGITSDFDYVREQILKEIKQIFKLNENEAYTIINSDDQEVYSQKVIETAEKNIEK